MRVARFHLPVAAFAVAFTGVTSLATPRPLVAQDPASSQGVVRSGAELERLVGPIALYADPMLAQVLLATTFPDQVREAADFVRANGTGDIDSQPWDVSVKAIAHYPAVLNLLDSKPDWMNELGQAYATQSSDVMAAVQRLRQSAVSKGNLVTTPQQQVVTESNQVAIWPANPRVIYVPVYDPEVVYVRYAGYYGPRPFISFGFGYPIGPWFIYDTDWVHARVIYTGWIGGGWIGRSRPYVVMNPIYVHERYRQPVFGHYYGWGGRTVATYRPSPRPYWDGRGYRNEGRGEFRGEGRGEGRGEFRGEGRGDNRGPGNGRGNGWGNRGGERGGDRGEIRRGGERTAVPRGESRGGDMGRGQGGNGGNGGFGGGNGAGNGGGRGQGGGQAGGAGQGQHGGGQVSPAAPGNGGGWSRGGFSGRSGGGNGGGNGGGRGEGRGGGREGGHGGGRRG